MILRYWSSALKEYVKMCEKSDEIQNEFEGNEYDIGCLLSNINPKKNLIVFVYQLLENPTSFPGKEYGGLVWLPRQDQLQEMVEKDNFSVKATSMEQLWLAFVMKEKYNKQWNGEGWVDG